MTTVRENWGMCCPDCLSDESLNITAQIDVLLLPNGSDADESRDGDHVWSSTSTCTCGCGWGGTVTDAQAAHTIASKAEAAGWEYEAYEGEWRKTDDDAPDGYRYAATAEHALRQEASQ